MNTASIAALLGALVLGFVEGLRRFYPARSTWRKMRRARGRLPMLKMRERFEGASTQAGLRIFAVVFLVLAVAWIAAASLLDKRWHEVLFDVLPTVLVGIAVMRVPLALRGIAERMKEYEKEIGDDQVIEDDGPPGPVTI